MKSWSSHSFKIAAKKDGISDDIISNAINTAKALKQNNIPPIFTLKHLSVLSGVEYVELRKIVSRLAHGYKYDNYHVFRLRKKTYSESNRERIITVPEINTLKVQRWIHRNILQKVDAHECSFAFHSEGGIIKAARPHCNCKWMIKIDITNYFESILENKVYSFFTGLGYQPLMAFELTRICTRVKEHSNPVKIDRFDESVSNELPYTTLDIGHLPQGAPTSPLLSNLCSLKLDEDISDLALASSMNYTRYADDIILSSTNDFDRSLGVEIINEIFSILKRHGYWPNRAKTKLVTPGARKIVLGLLVDGDSPRLTKEFKKDLKSHLYYSGHANIGLDEHRKRRGFNSAEGYINFLNGKLSYAHYVEPDWAKPLILEFYKIKNEYLRN